MIKIDINCDLGEGVDNEALLMPLISSCNIACGGHAGNETIMREVVELAKKHDVKIGAHPSFPDQKNFGRKIMKMSPEGLHDSIYNQVQRLKIILDQQDLPLHHIKPHGALYNLAAIDEETATVIVDVLKRFEPHVLLYAPFQSVVSQIATNAGLKVRHEAFADRNYNTDLTLVSRTNPKALIQDSEQMFEQVYHIISEQKVTAIDGVEVKLKADTFCVHGDGKNVIKNLKDLILKLEQNSIGIF
ncbi:5-oxoprolinase subunit PxpA [Psychroserpens algicola]|uniref:5-oxoprolinase subunit PxpA n=1 Tax=Psychroserpens algicola TaxID=1719034 RepID=A0ABT0HBF5_9FLAO|nr:5-oxoprolinase subunit PxpA [Psychroserpens algicola]